MHSGMEALFMPYDHIPDIPQGPGAQASLHILQQLNTSASAMTHLVACAASRLLGFTACGC